MSRFPVYAVADVGVVATDFVDYFAAAVVTVAAVDSDDGEA